MFLKPNTFKFIKKNKRFYEHLDDKPNMKTIIYLK